MFKDDNTLIHFKKPSIQFSVRENLMSITGMPETKTFKEMMPGIMNQIGPQQFGLLQEMMKSMGSNIVGEKPEEEEDEDDVPELVGDVNFEETAKK